MKLLLDTCVLAEFTKTKIDPNVEQFISHQDANALYVSVITFGEINKGIHLLPSSKRKTTLQTWAQVIENNYQDRLLYIDLTIANLWGEITAIAQKKGKAIPAVDGLLAATAIAHGLHLVTRNVNDFKHIPVLVINPWDKIK